MEAHVAVIELKPLTPWAQLFRLDFPLSAVHHVRRMKGATQAHLMRASDGRLHVIKFQNNPHSARVLASEFLATRLGVWLGLPMPQVEVIYVPEWLINHELLRIEMDDRFMRCASGRQLACRYITETSHAILQSSIDRVSNWSDLIRILVFDKWIGNCDNRQVVYRKYGKQYRAIFIDQHQCFNARRWTFPDLPFHGTYRHKCLYRDVISWQSFEPTLSRIQKISRFDLWKFATEVPPEWYQHDTAALSRLIEQLYRRRSSVRDLISKFRKSSINPFPHWKEN
jgi:hypothetical protein